MVLGISKVCLLLSYDFPRFCLQAFLLDLYFPDKSQCIINVEKDKRDIREYYLFIYSIYIFASDLVCRMQLMINKG